MYHTQEFAKLAGLTVRALHHYDRLGLLKPHRTGSGYRAYCESDLERLEQVVALKFLGLPLKQIKRLLETAGCDLPAALQLQRKALEAKRRLLDRAIAAIREAETVVEAGRQPGASLPAYAALKKIIEVIEVQNNQDWMAKYQNDAAKAKIAVAANANRHGREAGCRATERCSWNPASIAVHIPSGGSICGR